ncbi:uncharacterized protein LOC122066974 [Macadamia integrifolia]|uniref:uncharacterized protein LOC122066974 n=1 Tax=Macadamia integrifolia TaxID=60698 RepID=UPI001C4ECA17|nr:uncharacterized protein LOC122066974 [Macadamia integrifolia]
MTLNTKNKLAFIDGSLLRLAKNSSEFSTWDRVNDMVVSWIYNAFTGDISDSILHGSSAHDIWIDLWDRFSQSLAPQIFELTRSIATLQQDNLSIMAYYSKLKAYWNEPASISAHPSSRGHILLMDPVATVTRAYNLLLQKERQRSLHVQPNPQQEGVALTVKLGAYSNSLHIGSVNEDADWFR